MSKAWFPGSQLLTGALLATVATACAAPSSSVTLERGTVVKEDVSPGLHECRSGVASTRTVHLGDVLLTGRPWPAIRWRGKLDGQVIERAGVMVEARTFESDGVRWVFEDALQRDVEVPTAHWMCEAMGNPQSGIFPCPALVRRVAIPGGAYLGWLSCSAGPCPLTVVRHGVAKTTQVDGMSDFRLLVSGSRAYGIATRRWVHSPELTGGSALIFEVFPGFERLAEILLDRVDARSPQRIASRLGELKVRDNWISYEGTETVTDRLTGQAVGEPKQVRESYWIEPQGQFYGR